MSAEYRFLVLVSLSYGDIMLPGEGARRDARSINYVIPALERARQRWVGRRHAEEGLSKPKPPRGLAGAALLA